MTVSELPATETPAKDSERDYFVRFKTSQRIEHIVLMVTFILLAVTGLAQKFYTAGWAEWLILHMGGISVTRLIHRIFAGVFTLSILYHFAYLFRAVFIKHSKLTMMPTVRDLRDVVNELRYSFGLADRPPRFGRFDYRQKFEYWGIIFGGLIIIISGAILMFPTAVTLVLPGQVVPAAKEFHGNEATLAVIVIVIWHLYDVMFRPGIFPADTTIFTGKLSRKRMAEEHALEYAELTGATPDDETPASPPEAPGPAGQIAAGKSAETTG